MHFLYTKHFCIIFLCCFCSIAAFGQDIASFKKMRLTHQSKFITEKQHTEANIEAYLAIYLASAIEAKDTYHEAKAYYNYCLVQRNKKNIAQAHYFIDKAIAIAKQRNDTYDLGTFYHRKGTVFYAHGVNKSALDYYLKAFDLLKKTPKEFKTLLNLRYDIATIKLKAKHYDEALTRFRSIANTYDSLFKKPSNASIYATSYVHVLAGLAEAYTEKDFLKEAMTVYEKALHISITHDYKIGTYIALGGKGKVLNHQKNYSKALIPINEAIQMTIDDTNSKGILPFLYAHKGESYFGLEEFDKAILNFKKTDSIIHTDGLDFIELDYVSKLLGDSYKKLKDYKNASHYYDIYFSKDDVNDKERIKLRETLYQDFELDNMSEALESAKEEKGIFQNRFYISLIIIVCIGIALMLTIFYNKRKQQKNKEKFDALMKSIATKETLDTTKKSFVISDETSKEILDKLADFESSKSYLDKKYNLAVLAKQFHTNSNYLSKIINTNKQKSFSQYLIDLRIDYIIIELKNNKKLRSYTIQAIAEEIGFNKAESFARAFKKKTGLNPSYYIKNIENV